MKSERYQHVLAPAHTTFSCIFSIQKIKEQVAELDKKTRTMSGLLNKIHSTPSAQRTLSDVSASWPLSFAFSSSRSPWPGRFCAIELQRDERGSCWHHPDESVLALERDVVDISTERSICCYDGGVPRERYPAHVAAST